MAQFSVNAERFDPYKNFKFQLWWDGEKVAGISKVSPLKRTTEVIKHREGGESSLIHRTPGRTEYEAVTMEGGLTQSAKFAAWADKVWRRGQLPGAEVSLKDFRKEIVLEILNEAGQVALKYNLHGCWVSELQATPELDANAGGIAIEHIKIEIEGWTRTSTEPTEQAFG